MNIKHKSQFWLVLAGLITGLSSPGHAGWVITDTQEQQRFPWGCTQCDEAQR